MVEQQTFKTMANFQFHFIFISVFKQTVFFLRFIVVVVFFLFLLLSSSFLFFAFIFGAYSPISVVLIAYVYVLCVVLLKCDFRSGGRARPFWLLWSSSCITCISYKLKFFQFGMLIANADFDQKNSQLAPTNKHFAYTYFGI